MSETPAGASSPPGGGAPDGLVLDSYAILALLEGERAADEMAELLAGEPERPLLMTYVNLGEVLYTIIRERGQTQADAALLALEESPLTFVPADRTLTLAAAGLKARHRISYADAYCAALAHISGFPLVTGDPEFRALEGTVRVRWVGAAEAEAEA